jgi:hypothetical protein
MAWYFSSTGTNFPLPLPSHFTLVLCNIKFNSLL